MLKHRLILIMAAVLAGPVVARSQESAELPSSETRATLPDPVLDALVAEALQKNPDIAGAASAAEAARLRIAAARTLPDPSISLTYQNDGTSFSLGREDMTFLGAMYSQPLPWPGKLRLAGEEARNRAEEIKEGRVGRARLAVEARVRRAYYDYLLAQAQLELIEDRSRSWHEISEIVRARYSVGIGVQQDVLRAQVEVLRLDEARAEQGAQLASRRSEINRVVGRPAETPVDTTARLALHTEAPDLGTLLRAAADRSPELAAASRAVEAARARVELAEKNLRPDFVASGGPMYRGGLDPMWQVGLGVSLPLFAGSRQRPLLSAARSDVRAEDARVSATRQELEFRTRERYESLSAARKIAHVYSEGVLPVDQLSLESAIASYRAGRVPFVTVLESLNTLYADRALLLVRLAEVEKWRVTIDEADVQAAGAMGAPVAAVPATAGVGAVSGAMSSAAPMR